MPSNTTRKGDIAEQKIILELLKRGYDVFRPVNNDSFIDLVILREGKLEKIQIKYATAKEAKISVRLYSGSTVVDNRISYNSTDVDWMIVYCPDTDSVYYLPKKAWAHLTGIMTLRLVDEGKRHPTANYVTDYTTI